MDSASDRSSADRSSADRSLTGLFVVVCTALSESSSDRSSAEDFFNKCYIFMFSILPASWEPSPSPSSTGKSNRVAIQGRRWLPSTSTSPSPSTTTTTTTTICPSSPAPLPHSRPPLRQFQHGVIRRNASVIPSSLLRRHPCSPGNELSLLRCHCVTIVGGAWQKEMRNQK